MKLPEAIKVCGSRNGFRGFGQQSPMEVTECS